MKQFIFIILVFVNSYVFAQHLTPVDSTVTLKVKGEVLFIDSLDNMQAVQFNNEAFHPYYLVLLRIETIDKKLLYSDNKLVFRTNNIKPFKINEKVYIDLELTLFKKVDPFIINETNELNCKNLDDLSKQIDVIRFYWTLLEKRPGLSYYLKENQYYLFKYLEND